jgi:hypothetical protein
MHDTTVLCLVPGSATVQDTAVIPDNQVSGLPFMSIGEIRLRGGCNKVLQQGAAFFNGPPHDM